MLLTYDISAVDLGSAINLAIKRAQNDGFSHANIQSTKQVAPGRWEIVVFASNSQGLTRR